MLVISKKRIQIVLSCLIMGLFAFSFQIAENNNTIEQKNIVETTATPVSGKIVVIDAGHGVPDEGAFLLYKENKQLTFYKCSNRGFLALYFLI